MSLTVNQIVEVTTSRGVRKGRVVSDDGQTVRVKFWTKRKGQPPKLASRATSVARSAIEGAGRPTSRNKPAASRPKRKAKPKAKAASSGTQQSLFPTATRKNPAYPMWPANVGVNDYLALYAKPRKGARGHECQRPRYFSNKADAQAYLASKPNGGRGLILRVLEEYGE